MSDLNSYIQENIEGNRLVKTFGNEQKEINQLKKIYRKVKDKNMKIQNVNINYNTKVTFLSYCMQLLLVVSGGIFVINGYTTLGEFIIINSFISTIKRPFIELSGFIYESNRSIQLIFNKEHLINL